MRFGSFDVLRPLLSTLLEEALVPGALLCMAVPASCRLLRCKPLAPHALLDAPHTAGHTAVSAHWDPCVVKLAAGSIVVAWSALVGWAIASSVYGQRES